ncbi:unnamed protein product [Rhodiola kirilowii]
MENGGMMINSLMSLDVNDDDDRKGRVFRKLKVYCLHLLDVVSNPSSASSTGTLTDDAVVLNVFILLVLFLCSYALFPLLLVFDAAVECRRVGSEEKAKSSIKQQTPHKIKDSAAEIVVVLMKKLTYGAMLSPDEAAEEFRIGVIRCFKAVLLNLPRCSSKSCSCKQIKGLPALLAEVDHKAWCTSSLKFSTDSKECHLAFLRSQSASAAIGHWLSLLLKAADTEAVRGHHGSATLRVEAFLTLRVLVAKQIHWHFSCPVSSVNLAKVLHISKSMITGASGSSKAVDHAIRGLAEYLMIVLEDDVDISGSHTSTLDELRHMPVKDQTQLATPPGTSNSKPNHVDHPIDFRGKENVPSNLVGRFLCESFKRLERENCISSEQTIGCNFPHICVNPSKNIRMGLLVAVQGLLSKCYQTLKQSRLMFLECLCTLVCDDCKEVSKSAQEYLEHMISSSRNYEVESDITEILNSLVEKLPKLIFGNEESVVVANARQFPRYNLTIPVRNLSQIIFYALRCPVPFRNRTLDVTASKILDTLALCLSQNALYAGSFDKLVHLNHPQWAYLPAITELNAITQFGKTRNPALLEGPKPQMLDTRLQGVMENESTHRKVGNLGIIKTGSGQMLRQASTAVCMLNEMIYGISDEALNFSRTMFRAKQIGDESPQHQADNANRPNTEHNWTIKHKTRARSQLINCIDNEFEEVNLHSLGDTAMLHQVIIEGIGIFNICLGNDFVASGFLQSSLFILLENLICSKFEIRMSADAVLHVLAATAGHQTVGHLVIANSDYIIDSICRQLRHLDIHPHVASVLAVILSYIGVARNILPLLDEPAIAGIVRASKGEASSMPGQAELYASHVKSEIAHFYPRQAGDSSDCNTDIPLTESGIYPAANTGINDKNDEDGITALAEIEAAYMIENETKEAIEEEIQTHASYDLQDTLDAASEGTDENRLLPAMNKIWPLMVVCVESKTQCHVVQVCGGDFFLAASMWMVLTSGNSLPPPLSTQNPIKKILPHYNCPYRKSTTFISSEDRISEISSLRVQISGLVVGIACSGVTGLREASIHALSGLASVDPDLIWLLLADVYYSLKQTDSPAPPTSEFPDLSQILPPPDSHKEFLYVQYGGRSFWIRHQSCFCRICF